MQEAIGHGHPKLQITLAQLKTQLDEVVNFIAVQSNIHSFFCCNVKCKNPPRIIRVILKNEVARFLSLTENEMGVMN